MEWSDTGIVVSVRAHGESSAVVEMLTRSHGRHLGFVRAGKRKTRGSFQPGNTLCVHWRARLPELLGNFSAELSCARAGDFIDSRKALAGLNAFTSIVSAALPEREVHINLYDASEILLDAMRSEVFSRWAPLYVRWEIGLLEALGFGLDLSQCAATGTRENLLFVSPRTGRAVSAAAGEPYSARLMALPAFVLASQNSNITHEDIVAGLHLTSHFLRVRVLGPNNRTLPQARLWLDELAFGESRRRSNKGE